MTVVVVLGATGIIGSGVVKYYLDQNNITVVAPVRGDPQKLFTLLGEHFSLHKNLRVPPSVDYSTKDGAATLAEWIKQNIEGGGQIDHVFVVSGGMATYAPVSHFTEQLWKETSDLKILPVVYAAQTLLPLLKDNQASSFTVITGLLGEYCPNPAVAPTTVANAAVYGLTLALQAENKAKQYRINELRIGALIANDGEQENAHFPGMKAAPTSRVARFYDDHIVTTFIRDSVVRIKGEDVGL